jgi:inorganic pyrophosphatase
MSGGAHEILVVVEIPKGSRNKYLIRADAERAGAT